MLEGSYGEKEKKFRWWPLLVFGLIVIVVFSLVFFAPDENIRFTGQPTTGCTVMQDRGYYDDSINIVFLGTEYNDLDQFREDTNNFMSSFLEVIPHNKYKNRFNFFRIEEFGEYGCQYDDAVVCNPKLVQREATKCPGQDVNVVLVSRDKVNNFFKHLRSSAWLSLISLNAADDPLVLAHEAAHVLYDFADEYEYGGKITWDAPNCDSEYETCPKFSVVEGSECHVGCVNSENSRPAFYDIMSNYWKNDRYEIYNEWYIENVILDTTKELPINMEDDGDPKESPENIYVVEGSCDIDGNCNIENIQMSPLLGYRTSSKLVDTNLQIKHGSYVVNIPKQPILFKDYGPEGSMEVKEYSFSVAVPVDEKDNKIILVDNGKIEDAYILEERPISRTGYSKIVEIPGIS
jgi:hypothetical protein